MPEFKGESSKQPKYDEAFLSSISTPVEAYIEANKENIIKDYGSVGEFLRINLGKIIEDKLLHFTKK